MPNDILVIKINEPDPGHILERLERFEQTGPLIKRQIDLGAVAGHDTLRTRADPGQEHEHLLGRSVLGFIQDDKGVAQGAAPHISEWRDFDRLARDVALQLVRLEHIVQGVIERPEIRRDFLLEIARQKSKRLTRPPLQGG